MGLVRPVCVKCGTEMECVKNGVLVYHPFEHATPGPVEETGGDVAIVHTDRMIEGSWKDGDIDAVAYGDKYGCPKCGLEIVTGFGGTIVAGPFEGQQSQKQLNKMVADAKKEGIAVEIRRK